MPTIIADTGPLVALLDRSESRHQWALKMYTSMAPPLLVRDAVLLEVWHLLNRMPVSQMALIKLFESGVIKSDFYLGKGSREVWRLLQKYRDTPMDFADACVVRMSEIYPDPVVWTMDSDFLIYRRNGKDQIPLIYPSS